MGLRDELLAINCLLLLRVVKLVCVLDRDAVDGRLFFELALALGSLVLRRLLAVERDVVGHGCEADGGVRGARYLNYISCAYLILLSNH